MDFKDYKFNCYLIGAMENTADKDCGVGWRRKITPELKSRNVYVFDPTREEVEKVGMPTEEFHEKLTGWQMSGHYQKFVEGMRLIWKGKSQLIQGEGTEATKHIHILGDIDYVERSKFLIWHYKEGDVPGGTIIELAIAFYRGIPVYLVTDVPKSHMNKSILYFVLDSGYGEGKVFPNFNQMFEYIDTKYNLKKGGI